ncbi:MAG: cell wall hydrolase [Oscillospiraceae bacterium]|nr:cell wall hydrolase [Oscillospiraceae bacterium]
MKSEKLYLHLRRIIILTILICVASLSVSFTAGSQKKIEEQHTGEVFHVINEWLSEFDAADESDRNLKINIFHTLSNYQTQLENHIIQNENIDLEFDTAFRFIVDRFINNYESMIEETKKAADENIGEMELYFSIIKADIAELSEAFDASFAALDDDDDPDVDTEVAPDADETVDIRAYKAEIFAQLSDVREIFMGDDFISLKTAEIEMIISELTEIISLIESENIIDAESLAILSDMINSLIKTYEDAAQAAALEENNILIMIGTQLLVQRVWFEEHYIQLISDIENTEREDEYDEETVINQIEELEMLSQLIEDDIIVSAEFILSKSEHIEQLIEEYESELEQIKERIDQRNKAAASAATPKAAPAKKPSTPATTTAASNSKPAASSTASNNTSSSSASSNTGNTSSSTASKNNNNNYPSISSNCRDILARLVRLEAPNESADGKQAVAEVVLNRMVSSRWSHVTTVEEVIFDTKWGVQFTVKDLIWTDRGKPSTADFAAVDRALAGPNVLDKSYMFFAATARTQNDVIWIGAHAFSK